MRLQAILIALAACTGATNKRSGYVSVTSQQLDSPSTQAGDVEARFFTTEFPEVVSTSTPCELDRYNSVSFPDGKFDAGIITVSGTPNAIGMIPEPSGDYVEYKPFHDPTRTLFSGGEALTITASGNDVPAFAERLVAPAMIVVTSPSLTAGRLTIPIHQDLAVNWTGGSGLVQVSVGSITNGDLAVCRFPAGDGSGVIPHAVLEHIWHGGSVWFSIDSVDFVHVSLGDWRVDVSATFNGILPNDELASGYAELLN